jgi:hypothetical protein
MVVVVPLARSHTSLLEAVEVLLTAGGAGAAGGLIHGLFGDRLLSVPKLGPYVWGVAVVGAYMSALAFVALPAMGKHMITQESDWIVFICVTVLFGIVVGKAFAERRNA